LDLNLTTARDFAIALFIGALIGIERERRKASSDPVGVGGIRTFILLAQAGAISAWLSSHLETPSIFVATVLGISALVLAGYFAQVRSHPDSVGLTTETAAIGVTLLGGAVRKLGDDDLYAGLKLLIATFIALPLIPNETIDPWNALNPYKLWLLVILISCLSLVGYVAARWLGSERGTAVTAIAGGLVSSTAVTLAFARRSKEAGGAAGATLVAGGILLAWLVMFIRVAVVVAVVNRELLRPLLVPMAAMGIVSGLAALWLLRGGGRKRGAATGGVPLKNPFSLTSAIRFALVFAAVLLLVALVQHYFPGRGVYAIAALAGLTDVDAITLSMTSCVGSGECSPDLGAGAIVLATLSNTLVKLGLAVWLGAAALRIPMLVATAAIVAVGLAAVALG
jgi:uncharacterized membrane protein (DUF4010 family)